VNFVCLRVFTVEQLALTKAPASEVMRIAMGEAGARFIAIGIAVSTIGFLSQAMLTAPRVYYAMAEDRLFFKSVGWVHPTSRVPVVAIVLQGLLASAIALMGVYEQILAYVVSADFIFFGLTGLCVFLLRKKDARSSSFNVPGHPWTTLFFVIACVLVVMATVVSQPRDSLIGLCIAAAGVPVYFLWRRRAATPDQACQNPVNFRGWTRQSGPRLSCLLSPVSCLLSPLLEKTHQYILHSLCPAGSERPGARLPDHLELAADIEHFIRASTVALPEKPNVYRSAPHVKVLHSYLRKPVWQVRIHEQQV
jgi:hypothetical protein